MARFEGPRPSRLFGVLAVLVLLTTSLTPMATSSPADADATQVASFSLDGVTLSLRTPFLPSTTFTTSEAGAASQVATSVAWGPFRELSISAVPLGTTIGTEALPPARTGGANDYYAALKAFRQGQGAHPQAGPTAELLGQKAVGLVSRVTLDLGAEDVQPTLIVEWVVEAGPRLWIVRVSQEQDRAKADEDLNSPVLKSLESLVLQGSGLDAPSTVPALPRPSNAAEGGTAIDGLGAAAVAGDLPFPSWWSGNCNVNRHRGSYPLGTSFLGVPTCGPLHSEINVFFYPGQRVAELEWQCAEYVKRYLYLAFRWGPYQANGSAVVDTYYNNQRDQTRKITNGTRNMPPQPGDVLSYGATSTNGHTSVVMEANVDGNGRGTIKVAEQNATASGTSSMNVNNWSVAGNAGSVTAWLRRRSAPCSTPSGQFCAEYYNNPNLSGDPTITRNEGSINFNWGGGGPGGGVVNDKFSARWKGRFTFDGTFTFIARADDGIRVYVDGDRIIDGWRNQPATEYRATRRLSGDHEVKVEYYDSTGDAVAQVRWERQTDYYQFSARQSGKCMDVAGASRERGATVQQWDCYSVDNQLWSLVPYGRYYKIVAKHSGKCLDVAGASRNSGAAVIQWDCTGGENQLWSLVAVGNAYKLVAGHSGKCLDVARGSRSNGVALQQWDCNGGDNQLWNRILR